MHLTLKKEDNNYQSTQVEVTSIKILYQPKNLLLVEKRMCNKAGNPNLPLNPTLDVIKVQFIGTAKLSISNELITIAAFVDPGKMSLDYWLLDVPNGYEQVNDNYFIVDYQGYIDSCNLIGTAPKSFSEYIEDDISEIMVY